MTIINVSAYQDGFNYELSLIEKALNFKLQREAKGNINSAKGTKVKAELKNAKDYTPSKNAKKFKKHVDYSKEMYGAGQIIKPTFLAEDRDRIIGYERNMLQHGQYLVQHYDEYLNILNGRTLLNEDNIALLDMGAVLANSVPHIVGVLLSIEPRPEYHTTLNATDIFNAVLYPPDLDYTKYGFDSSDGRVVNPEYRYIGNHSWHSVKKICDAKTGIHPNELVTAQAIKKMFLELSDQSRFGNVFTHLKTILESYQLQNSAQYWVNLPDCVNKSNIFLQGIDTVCGQMIQQIVKFYGTFPYRFKKNRIKIKTDKDISVLLPVIINCLISGAFQQLAGNLTKEGAEVYVQIIANYSSTSLVTQFLANKSVLRDYLKIVLDSFSGMMCVKYNELGMPYNLQVCESEGEFWFNKQEEIQLLQNEILSHPVTELRHYLTRIMNNILQLNKRFATDDLTVQRKVAAEITEYIRFLFIEFNCITNPGIYYKTSLVLEYVASIEPKFYDVPSSAEVSPKTYFLHGVNKIALNTTLTEELQALQIKFNAIYENDAGTLIQNKRDRWESLFITALTNKSGGLKSSDVLMNPLLRSVSNTRLIAFVLRLSEFLNIDTFILELKKETNCAIRYQTDRRARLIVIVSNDVQSMEIFLLSIFNRIKMNKASFMFVGKQVGDIRDAKSQLISSGDIHALKNNSDVKGMDTCTYPVISNFIRHLVIDLLMKYDKTTKPYFCTSGMTTKVYTRTNDRIIEEEKFIPASVRHMALIMHYMRVMRLKIPDQFFSAGINSTDVTFMSGLFGTSAQHTILLDLVTKVVQDRVDIPKNIKITDLIMGDDIFEVIYNYKGDEKKVLEYIAYKERFLRKLNYVQDSTYSRFHAKFLQQNALCGVYAPNPARTSVFFSERNDTNVREPMDVVKIMANVLQTVAQRSYSIKNVQSLLGVIWGNVRAHYIYVTETNYSQLLELRKKMTSDITGISTGFINFGPYANALITYPATLIYCPPISWPHPGFKSNTRDTFIPRGAETTMGGDSNLICINSLFAKSCSLETRGIELDTFYAIHKSAAKLRKPAETINQIKNKVEEMTCPLDITQLIDWEARAKFGFNFSEYLLKFGRKAMLSEKREEEVTIANIKQMSKVLEGYLDPGLKLASLSAQAELASKGIKVPHLLTYPGQEEGKIKQALASKLEDVPEFTYLDKALLKHVRAYEPLKIDEKSYFRMLLSLIKIEIIRKDVTPTNDGIINMELPILPGYHMYSDFGTLLCYAKTPLTHTVKTSGSISEITGELGTSFDLEGAVLFGAHVYSKLGHNLDKSSSLVGRVIGLSHGAILHYKNVLSDYLHNGLNLEYRSVFDNTKYFAISGDVDQFEDLIDVPITSFNLFFRRFSKNYLPTLKRDVLFSCVNRLKSTSDVDSVFNTFSLTVSPLSLVAMVPTKKRRSYVSLLLSHWGREA